MPGGLLRSKVISSWSATGDDRPGIVGAVRTILGNAEQNIANFSLARNKAERNALSIIELDDTLPANVMEAIRAIPGVTSATGVSL